MTKIQGLIAAPFTPFHRDGALRLEAIEGYADWLHRNGVVGAFVCGTTGEGMSLTVDERMKVAERWTQCAPPELRVIVHVGHTSLADATALAAHAESIGAHSISCTAPFFFKPDGIPGLVSWCERVAAAAPRLPFYYYHIPSMTGFHLSVFEFLQQASSQIPTLTGVKYTFEDLDDCSRCVAYDNGRYDVLFGRDELLLSALEFGIGGAVGSTYNFAAPLYQAIIEAHRQGMVDRAKELQALAVKMIDILVAGGRQPVATFKWFLQRIGLDCGPPRPPLARLTTEQIDLLESKLEASGIMTWVSK